jgi:CBS domain-containing protein
MKVSDIMTPQVATVSTDATVGEAIRVMLQKRISGLPVVDSSGGLAGIVTEGDFLRRQEIGTAPHAHWLQAILSPGAAATDYTRSHTRKIADVMTADVVSVTEDQPVAAAVKLMEKHRIKRIPVVRGRKLVGLVSRADLLRAFAGALAEVKPVQATDTAIRDSIIAEMQKESWAPTASVNVIVRDGVVHLWGSIFQDNQRTALKAMAAATPGVKDVQDHLIWLEPMSGMAIEAPKFE